MELYKLTSCCCLACLLKARYPKAKILHFVGYVLQAGPCGFSWQEEELKQQPGSLAGYKLKGQREQPGSLAEYKEERQPEQPGSLAAWKQERQPEQPGSLVACKQERQPEQAGSLAAWKQERQPEQPGSLAGFRGIHPAAVAQAQKEKVLKKSKMKDSLLPKLGTPRNQYFVYPPHPPLKILLAFLLLAWNVNSAKGQTVELPDLEHLERSLRAYLHEEWKVERSQYEFNQKGKLLKFLPSVGVGMGMPQVSYSTQTLFTVLEDKKRREAAIQAIDRKFQLAYNDELNSLRIQHAKLRIQKERLKFQAQAMETDQKIFAIHQEAFAKKEMKPLEFLQKKKGREDLQNSLVLAGQSFQIQVLELEEKAHAGLTSGELGYESREEPKPSRTARYSARQIAKLRRFLPSQTRA